tara:strand:- start:7144 stop:7491 length:348 start_codon:yes stop_codon:yes gene_type:complete
MVTQVGVGGILAVMVIREVLNFLKTRPEAGLGGLPAPGEDGCDEARAELDQIGERTEALVASTTQIAALVSATDPAGLPLIYRDSQAMTRLNTTLEALQRSIERLGDRVDRPTAT